MDEGQKFLWKAGAALFAILIAGSWIWSWVFPEGPNRYKSPTSVVTQTQEPSVAPGLNSYSVGPCDDEVTVADYKSCMEDQALQDWKLEREGEAGLP